MNSRPLAEGASGQRWGAVIAAAVAVFVAALDITVVNLAFPTLAEQFAAPPALMQWVILAYLLPVAALTLALGRWADGADPRAAFLLGITGFTVASVAAGLAPSLAFLLSARLVQGSFGALLFALVGAVVRRAVGPAKLGSAMGIIGSAGALGTIAGPGVGGLVIELVGWRGIFLINVAPGLLVAILAARSIPRMGRLILPSGAWAAEATSGGASVAAILGALTASAQAAWGVAALLGAAALVFLAVWSRSPGAAAVRLVAGRTSMPRGLIILLAIYTVTGILWLVPSIFTQDRLGLSPGEAGALLMVPPIVMVVVSPVAGRIADMAGSRLPMVLGTATACAGAALLVSMEESWTRVDVAWRLALFGAGISLATGPNMAAIMASAPQHALSTASGLSNLARYLGFALGPAMVTLLMGTLGEAAGMAAALAVAAAAMGVAAGIAAVRPFTSTRAAPEVAPDPNAAAPR